MGILCGIVGGLTIGEMTQAFIDGARDMTSTALLVGVARVMLVVMSEGLILDTIVHGLANAIAALPKAVTVLGMYVVQLVLNFFIPSGSGQAAATMPIMVPLADVLGINRQVAVLAFQFGDGFTNSIYPNGAILMANLGIAKITYDKWFKFMGPLMAIWIAIGRSLPHLRHFDQLRSILNKSNQKLWKKTECTGMYTLSFSYLQARFPMSFLSLMALAVPGDYYLILS